MSCGEDHFEPISLGPEPEPKPHRNWGGRRPGAGAPRGNLNAFRHGRYSTQQKDLARLLAEIPEARDALIRLAQQRRKRDAIAREGASKILAEILRRLGSIVVNPGNNHLEYNQNLIASLRRLEAILDEVSEKQSSGRP